MLQEQYACFLCRATGLSMHAEWTSLSAPLFRSAFSVGHQFLLSHLKRHPVSIQTQKYQCICWDYIWSLQPEPVPCNSFYLCFLHRTVFNASDGFKRWDPLIHLSTRTSAVSACVTAVWSVLIHILKAVQCELVK